VTAGNVFPGEVAQLSRVSLRSSAAKDSFRGLLEPFISSESLHHPAEVKQVRRYVEQLRALKSNRPTDDEIGIISPYSKQVAVCRCRCTRCCVSGVGVIPSDNAISPSHM
jgi:hypothetical protein